MPVKDYIRQRFFPQIWCPGCGHGIVMGGLIRAIELSRLERNEIVMVSGIGCSSRIAGYLDFHTMHTLHGRALAFATGVKLGRPYLKVIVPMGDGDALAIGGNHLIHAARRNIDVTAIIMNNNIYGMTGGQTSPLTPLGKKGTTANLGTIEHSFDIVELAKGAGASFLARTTTYHIKEMIKLIHEAINHRGFSLVEIMSQCPTYFGRKNEFEGPVEMMRWFKENTTLQGSKRKREHPELIERGVFVKEDRPEYVSSYMELLKKADAKKKNHVQSGPGGKKDG
jgi:2-oxoglutarate ferredoxin oxidoreductase subunit beta